ncbi:hypothetical protein NQ315_002168 [Exocentrus adspersus]|uniref:Methyltransferase domain-containing protein n=1 Tax=Exocentrus adspersus TaxID=1586481 RepID=A0AAV8VYS8_9CUCU|nr:hypothetical protein NQ315_002168 [Exocentrus adspersus]
MDEPETYSKNNDLQQTDNVFILDKYFRLVKTNGDDESILDIGVGDGKFAVEKLIPRFPNKLGKFVGCDVSEKMVQFAKEAHRDAKVEFVQLDVSCEEVPVDFEACFDHIFSFYTLHWVSKQRQAFKNMYRMLKPGGDMLLCFLANNPIYDVHLYMSEHPRWKTYMKKEYICPYHGKKDPEKTVEKLLKETGFTSHVCRVEKRSYYFPNVDIMKKSFFAVNPIVHRLPPKEVQDYMDDFLEKIKHLNDITIEIVNNNEEGVHLRYDLLVIFASKSLEDC